jgi:uncharacterized protein (TIGR02231 family)
VRIDLPLRRVTAYEDRAAFEREGAVTLTGGPLELEIEGVSPLVSDAHLSGALLDAPPGAAVDDVRVERRWVSVGGESAERRLALEHTLEAAADARFVTEQSLARSAERRAAAERELARFVEASARAAWNGLDVAAFGAGERRLAEALQTADTAVDAARRALQAATEHEQRLQGLLAQGRATRQVLETLLRVRVSGPAGAARLRIRGLYPCALWRPTHEAHLGRGPDGRERVAWTTAATLWQRTGEDWSGVEVTLSTARPGAGADLPALTEDRLRIRDRVPKPKVTVVAHRETAAARPDLDAAAPGVYDGGEARVWRAGEPVALPSDGRPLSVALAHFELPATTSLCAVPEVSGLVFLEAVLRNGERPLLAGPVTLLRDGAHVGVGDLDYVGPGEPFTLSFGSDDRFDLAYERKVVTEERMLGRDRPVYVHEVELLSRVPDRIRVEVVLRLPVSEMAAVKVVPAEKLCTEGAPRPDADGRVRTPLDLIPGRRRTLRVAFGIDSGADVHIPPPW